MLPLKGHDVLQGAIDLHAHAYPDPLERPFDDADLGEMFKTAGFRGVVTKTHHLGTAERVHLAQRLVPDVEVFGSLTLNYAVGGYNPFAVDAAVRYGAKVIWGPTVDSRNQGLYFGSLGQYSWLSVQGGRASAYDRVTGITVLDDNGHILPEVDEVLDVIAGAGIAMSVGHLTVPEIKAVVKRARERGVDKVWVDHPFLGFMHMADLQTQREVIELGAKLMFAYSEVGSRYHSASLEQVALHIRELGVANLMIGSDTGQHANPAPPEAIRIFVAGLLEVGVPQRDLEIMTRENPAWIIDG